MSDTLNVQGIAPRDRRPLITYLNGMSRPATDRESARIYSHQRLVTHNLRRRNSDWAIVCADCGHEFWAAGSSVTDPCPMFKVTGDPWRYGEQYPDELA